MLDKNKPPSLKANRILNFILLAFLLIIFRAWYLEIVVYEEKKEEAKKPSIKTIFEKVPRASIYDRFHEPLAINKIRFEAYVLYSDIAKLPRQKTLLNKEKQLVKTFPRKEHIQKIADISGKILNLSEDRVKDLIYSKACFFNHIPFVLKQDLNEEEYYKIKALEKSTPGLKARMTPIRFYPQKEAMGNVIGYTGAIQSQEYLNFIHEYGTLKNFLEANQQDPFNLLPLPFSYTSVEEVETRFQALEELGYKMDDWIGKTGIEATFENSLRGTLGKTLYVADAKGTLLEKIDGERLKKRGQPVYLTLSAELQTFAEKLLIQNESVRETKASKLFPKKIAENKTKEPWLKGGAIVVIDPKTSEILTLASYPRLDPNAFVPSSLEEESHEKQKKILNYIENPSLVEAIWNQKIPLCKEIFIKEENQIKTKKNYLTFKKYLELTLDTGSPITEAFKKHSTLEESLFLQRVIERLCYLTDTKNLQEAFEKLAQTEKEEANEELKKIKTYLDIFLKNIPSLYEKLLYIDLNVLFAPSFQFPQNFSLKNSLSLETYRNIQGSYFQLEDEIKTISKKIFRDTLFKKWREENEKEFLKLKRLEEKERNTYARPYIDYLDKEESLQFSLFWQNNKTNLLLVLLKDLDFSSKENLDLSLSPFITTLEQWKKELLLGYHPFLSWRKPFLKLHSFFSNFNEKETLILIESFIPYSQLNKTTFGSYPKLNKTEATYQNLASSFYPKQGFGFGRSYAYQQNCTLGSIFKLVVAYQALIEKYEKKPTASHQELNPLTIEESLFIQGGKTYLGKFNDGKPIPQIYQGGRIPKSAKSSLGTVDLLKAIETSSNPYFALLAKEHIKNPYNLNEAALNFGFGKKTGVCLKGEIKGTLPKDLHTNATGLYSFAIGQHTLNVSPLQTSFMLGTLSQGKAISPLKIDFSQEPKQEELSSFTIPETIKKIILEGMRRVVLRTKDTPSNFPKLAKEYPKSISSFQKYKNDFIGKTSTSEVVENINPLEQRGAKLYTHIWFGAISYDENSSLQKETFIFKDPFNKPELIIIVYLKYGNFGKDAIPLVAQIIEKWREIKASH